MFIQKDNTSVTEPVNFNRSNLEAIYPEDIPLIDAFDEESFTFSDGMLHIED
ncbi:hypothetical protein [Nitrosomonas oligotropha]|uniref:hypothetical protein n=1 Tax=Nitrosomonas oligotropha TaxID=42354 RepID=UPI00136C3179|nr:hypothetical protein [Nitrosomonas oligotropha]